VTEPAANKLSSYPSRAGTPYAYGQGSSANLADILERVLDKGIVIAGDIQINLLDIELLTIKLRLLVASVDKAKEMGIDWWEHDPALSSRAREDRSLAEENKRLRAEIDALRHDAALPTAEGAALSAAEDEAEEEAEEEAEDEAEEEPAPPRRRSPRSAGSRRRSGSRSGSGSGATDE